MGKLKIKFHPLFVLYVFLCIYFNWFNKIFFYVLVVTLHEYGHFLVARHYGYKIDALIFSLSGAGITTNSTFKEKHDIIISLSGPLVNLILIILTICTWWIFPLSYLYTYDFLICNIVVMLFNLAPIFPLDGGRILMSILALKGHNKNKLMNINKYICLVCGCLFLVLYIVSLFYKTNMNLAFIGIFLTINSITCKNNKYFDRVQCFSKNTKKPIEVKHFVVSTNNEKELIKYINPHYISVFENTIDGEKKIIKEEELIK